MGKQHFIPERWIGRGRPEGWTAPSACLIHTDLFRWASQNTRPAQKRSDVGEEMTLHIPNSVTCTFTLASINLFSGFERKLGTSLTHDIYLEAS
jgi:hypothetical protein